MTAPMHDENATKADHVLMSRSKGNAIALVISDGMIDAHGLECQ